MPSMEPSAEANLVPLAHRVLDRWQVDGSDRALLLPPSGETSPTPEQVDRAVELLKIHGALRLLFPEDPELRAHWVFEPHGLLAGARPIEAMRAGLSGLRRCANLLWDLTQE